MVNGIFSGTATITPTSNGLFTYALTCGGKESGFVTLSAKDDSLMQIVPPTPESLLATVNKSYDLAVQATGGMAPYSWTVSSGNLPEGITFASSASSGTFSGIPLQYGSYPLILEVEDSSPNPLKQTLSITITVSSGLTMVQNLQNPVQGATYTGSLAPDTMGGLPPYTWQLTGGNLPKGLQLNTSTGVISGTPTVAGPFSFTITVSDSEGTPAKFSATFGLQVAGPLEVITASPLAPAGVGVPYTVMLEASGGQPPYSWSFANNGGGNVPPGMNLATDGTFSGTPTQYTVPVGQYNNFNVIVSDSSTPKQTAPATLAIAVASTLKIETSSLPNGTVGVVTDVPLAATGGVPPYTWTASATPNPNIGIQVINGNVLEINPTIALISVVTLSVKDSEATADQKTVNLNLTTLPALVATTTTLTSSTTTAGTGEGVTLTSNVTPLSGLTPTGQMTFASGTSTLGTASLDSNGNATLQTTFAATGVFNITATYSGNGVDAGSVSTPLTETVVTPGITTAVSPVSLTVKPGSSGQLVITITPVGGYTGTIDFTCGTLPAHISCTFAPPSLSIMGAGPFTDTLTVSTNGSQTAALVKPAIGPNRGGAGGGLFTATTLWLPGSLAALLGLVRRRQKGAALRGFWIIAILGLAAMGTLSSCGSSNNARPGTYTIPISIAVSGEASQNITATVVVQ